MVSVAGNGNTEAGRREATPSNFLAQLDPLDRRQLRAISQERLLSKGEVLFSAGDPGEYVFLLQSGRIKIHQLSGTGREVILWFCLPGEIFGLAEVAQGGGREVCAEACEASQVLVLTQDQFKGFITSHPQAALLSIQAMASRLRVLGHVLVNLVSDDVNTRIAKLLLRLSARYGQRVGQYVHLSIRLTHQEIADMVGTTRQTVTSVLADFRRRGVLRMDNRRILIESEDRLTGMIRESS